MAHEIIHTLKKLQLRMIIIVFTLSYSIVELQENVIYNYVLVGTNSILKCSSVSMNYDFVNKVNFIIYIPYIKAHGYKH